MGRFYSILGRDSGQIIHLSGILGGIAIGLLFGALAAIVPARQASRLQVVDALRYE